MRVAVISPHLDDAVFSVAEHMLSHQDWEFTIVTPFGGQPTEEPHRSKYIILHDEHQRVCEYMGWDFINGPFLDDAARTEELQFDDLMRWMGATLVDFDQMWWPMGIHHPDHELVNMCWFQRLGVLRYTYEELPYRVLYPERVRGEMHLQGYDPSHLHTKRELCRMYASQVDDEIERCLYAPERLWGPR